ncbi:DnaA N-terminal domain-containing protein [Mesobacillus sp.]|uniref:DnaA N-terminal domain-containing protein n=1 Tax=Mesobacillus sp. TaxID=2675271 RepID=UPI0039F078C8
MEEEKRNNLKGKSDNLEYFREVETGMVEPRLRLLKEESQENLVTRTYYYPQKDKVKFTEEEVRKFSLDSYGESIPYIDGELTIFNNYLFDFWGYYLNAEGLALYGHLKRHAYGNKDWCFPNFELISQKMDKSRPTIHNFMELLERYGFAYKFGVWNLTRDGIEEGPIFKIRKKVPLLSKKLIYGDPDIFIPDDAPPHIKKALKKEQQGLPKKLRMEHEKYVKTMINNNEPVKMEVQVDFEGIYKQWLQYGELIKASQKNKTSKSNKTANQVKLERSMNEDEVKLLEYIKTYMQEKISKPSFDTWFANVLLKKDNELITVIAPNEFARDWLQEKYIEYIRTALKDLELEVAKIHFDVLV